MIFMKAQPGARFTGANGMIYTADTDGLISSVATHDVVALREQGAGHATVPFFKHLKLHAAHALYFEGATHKADANGILRNVPRDHAAALIDGCAAREATEAELAEPLPVTEQPRPASEPVTEPMAEIAPAAETVPADAQVEAAIEIEPSEPSAVEAPTEEPTEISPASAEAE
jgi:hypothetical protein